MLGGYEKITVQMQKAIKGLQEKVLSVTKGVGKLEKELKSIGKIWNSLRKILMTYSSCLRISIIIPGRIICI